MAPVVNDSVTDAALVALLSTNGAVAIGWFAAAGAVAKGCGGGEGEEGEEVLHTRLPFACQKQDTLALRGAALVGWGVLQDMGAGKGWEGGGKRGREWGSGWWRNWWV